MISLDELHDATLDSIKIFWDSGRVECSIQAYMNKSLKIKIIAEGATSLVIPKFEPWGPSDFIKKVWEENSGEAIKLMIEMQSGDLIEARIKKYIIQIQPDSLNSSAPV